VRVETTRVFPGEEEVWKALATAVEHLFSEIALKECEEIQHAPPSTPTFRRALSNVDLPTFGIPRTSTFNSVAAGYFLAMSTRLFVRRNGNVKTKV
jgi:hypothetical protein